MYAPATSGELASEEIVLPGLPIVDPHVHMWNIRGYDYFAPELLADMRSGHNVEASIYVECGMGASADPGAAPQPVAEVKFVLEQVRSAPATSHALAAGIVGFADLRLGEQLRPMLQAQIAAGEGRFRGIRAFVAWHPDPAVSYPNTPRYAQGNVMQDESFRAGARCLAQVGLVIDLWCFHTQLDDAAGFAASCPQVPILLNHCGGPLGIGPYVSRHAEVFAAWSASIGRLAAFPNVHIKLSGLGMKRAGFHFARGADTSSDELSAAWTPYVHTCLNAFGPLRMIFASNYPVDSETAPYRTLVNAYKKTLMDLPDSDLRAIFAGNARRFYKL